MAGFREWFAVTSSKLVYPWKAVKPFFLVFMGKGRTGYMFQSKTFFTRNDKKNEKTNSFADEPVAKHSKTIIPQHFIDSKRH